MKPTFLGRLADIAKFIIGLILAILLILWNAWGCMNTGWVLEHSPY